MMLIVHESLMRFRALLSANNHKIYNLLLSKVSLYYVYIPSWRKFMNLVICPTLCVKTILIRPKGNIVWKAFIIQLTKELDFVDLRT